MSLSERDILYIISEYLNVIFDSQRLRLIEERKKDTKLIYSSKSITKELLVKIDEYRNRDSVERFQLYSFSFDQIVRSLDSQVGKKIKIADSAVVIDNELYIELYDEYQKVADVNNGDVNALDYILIYIDTFLRVKPEWLDTYLKSRFNGNVPPEVTDYVKKHITIPSKQEQMKRAVFSHWRIFVFVLIIVLAIAISRRRSTSAVTVTPTPAPTVTIQQ